MNLLVSFLLALSSLRLLTDPLSVDFPFLLDRFSIQSLRGLSTFVYNPQTLKSKDGQNNPKTRRNEHPLTVSLQEKEVEKIDAQIEELTEMKRGYEAKAIRAENQADRLQFRDQYVLETRRYYQVAAENRMRANRIQEEIDRLKARRDQLLYNHGAESGIHP